MQKLSARLLNKLKYNPSDTTNQETTPTSLVQALDLLASKTIEIEQSDTSSGGSSEMVAFDQILYVDMSSTDLTQTGSFTAPFSTIKGALDFLGQPVDANDFRKNILIDVITPGTYADNLTVPHRAITIRGRGVKISGNITREIGDEYEYGTSSSTWRGTLTIWGSLDARDTHNANRQGIVISGNYRCTVAAGKTGYTTHDTVFINTKMDGTVQSDDGVIYGGATATGQEVLYAFNSKFKNTIEGRNLYCQRFDTVRLETPKFLVYNIVNQNDVNFVRGDIWSGYNPIDMTVTSDFDQELPNFLNSTFKLVALNIPTNKTVKLDSMSAKSWMKDVTTNNPITLEIVDDITYSQNSVTFNADFTNYGSGFAPASYYKDKDVVHLRGVIKYDGTNAPEDQTIFTLPSGYRPEYNEVFAVVSGTSMGECTIQSNGDVIQSAGETSDYSLSGIMFKIS